MPTIYRNSNQYSGFGNGEYVSLTQAEYNQLSEAEKDNGNIYFITDGVDDTKAVIGTGELETEADTIIPAINEISNKFDGDYIKCVSFSFNVSIAANGTYTNTELDVSSVIPSGYKGICVLPIASGSNIFYFYQCNFNANDNYAIVQLRSIHSGAYTATPTIGIICIKQ